jgi:hypothetical protein
MLSNVAGKKNHNYVMISERSPLNCLRPRDAALEHSICTTDNFGSELVRASTWASASYPALPEVGPTLKLLQSYTTTTSILAKANAQRDNLHFPTVSITLKAPHVSAVVPDKRAKR